MTETTFSSSENRANMSMRAKVNRVPLTQQPRVDTQTPRSQHLVAKQQHATRLAGLACSLQELPQDHQTTDDAPSEACCPGIDHEHCVMSQMKYGRWFAHMTDMITAPSSIYQAILCPEMSLAGHEHQK